MEEFDFSKGHPLDNELIEYKSNIEFFKDANGNINFNLINLPGGMVRIKYFQLIKGYVNEDYDIPNYVFPDNFSSLNPSIELLDIIKKLTNQTDTKGHIFLDGVRITDEDDDKYFLSKNYNLTRINTSSLKDQIKVEQTVGAYKITTTPIMKKVKTGDVEKTVIDEPSKIMYIMNYDINKGVSVSNYQEADGDISKEIILGIEFAFYQAYNVNMVSRLTGLYKSEFLYVYDRTRFSAQVDNDTQTVDENIFWGMNKLKISDIKYYSSNPIGDFDYVSSKKILIKGPSGYALSGIQYMTNKQRNWGRDGTRAVSNMVFAFDSIYEPDKSTIYYQILNGNLTQHQTNPLSNQGHSVNMFPHDPKIFISNFDVLYSPEPTEQNMKLIQEIMSYVEKILPMVIISLIKFPYGFLSNFINPQFWTAKWDTQYYNSEELFAGVKGFFSAQTISLKNDLVYNWLKDYDALKSCDTIVDNLYDPETIEETYGKYIKSYYMTNTREPSPKCKLDILYPYCNSYKQLEYMITFEQEISQLTFSVEDKNVELISKDLKSNIIRKINSILPTSISCFDINKNDFVDDFIITFLVVNPDFNQFPYEINKKVSPVGVDTNTFILDNTFFGENDYVNSYFENNSLSINPTWNLITSYEPVSKTLKLTSPTKVNSGSLISIRKQLPEIRDVLKSGSTDNKIMLGTKISPNKDYTGYIIRFITLNGSPSKKFSKIISYENKVATLDTNLSIIPIAGDIYELLPVSNSFQFKLFNGNTQLDIELIDDKKVLEGDRCRYFCSYRDINCDNTIEKYCLNSKNDIIDSLGNRDNESYFINQKISFEPIYFDLNLPKEETSIDVYLPNQTKIVTDKYKICGCFIAKYKEYKTRLTNFYNTIKSKYDQALRTETNENTKQKINEEIQYIEYLKKTLVLNDAEDSFKLALKLQLQDPSILNDYKTECSFPSCKQSTYKLFNMKNTTNCNEKQGCIGNGFAVPSGTKTEIACNMETGFENLRCVINSKNDIEPKFTLLANLKNYQNCKDIYKQVVDYTELDRPSYCKISSLPRQLGCEGNNMKYVYDVNQKQYPVWREDLCPPPNDQLPIGYKNPDLRFDYDNCFKKNQPPETNKNYTIIAVGLTILFFVLIAFLLKKILK